MLACLLSPALTATATAAPQRAIKAVGAAGLVRPSANVIDTVLAPRFERAASTSTAPAAYATPDGARVSVDVSSSYRRDPAVVQRLVDFVDSLVHGPELSRLSISIRTPDELHGICGLGADACYAPVLMRMVVPGEDLPDVTLEHLLAHEYGHHVLANQRNEPWDANAWGAKRWATHEHICSLEAGGEVFPGDEGEHYTLNPAEGFAEAFRKVNAERAGTWGASPWIADPLFYPDKAAARLLEQDVLHPLGPPRVIRHTVRLATGNDRRWRVATPWDGVLHASAASGQVRLLDASGRPLSRWKRRANFLVCGRRSVVGAAPAAPHRRYVVTVRRP